MNERSICVVLLSAIILVPVMTLGLSFQVLDTQTIEIQTNQENDSNVELTSSPNPDTNGTDYVLTISETISISEVVVIGSVVVGTSIIFRIGGAPVKIDELRKRRRQQFLLREARSGLLQAKKNAEKYLRRSKRYFVDRFQYPTMYYVLLGLPKYPTLGKLALIYGSSLLALR